MVAAAGSARPEPAPVRSTSPILVAAAAVVVLAGVSFAREIAAPLALAAVIVIIVHPIRRPLERRGWSRWAATTVVIVVAYLILAALAAMLAFAGIRFGALVVDYFSELSDTTQDVITWLSSLGLEEQAADTVASVLDPSFLFGVAETVSGWVLGILTAFFFVLAYVIFMAADAAHYRDAHQAFRGLRDATLDRFERYASNVRRYFVVNASFGAVVAIIDGIALWAVGVPAPTVWAILAFVTNFIPNIGFVLGLVPPAILALVVGGWPLMLAVIAIYSVVNVVLQVLVQPKFVADAVSLSLTLSFFSVVFWTFVIGPLGAILAIPLTLLARALLLEGDPRNGWARWLSGDRDAVEADVAGEPPPAAEPEPAAGVDPADARPAGADTADATVADPKTADPERP